MLTKLFLVGVVILMAAVQLIKNTYLSIALTINNLTNDQNNTKISRSRRWG